MAVVMPCLAPSGTHIAVLRLADAGATAIGAFDNPRRLTCLMLHIVVPALFVEEVVACQTVYDLTMIEVFHTYRTLMIRTKVLRDNVLPLARMIITLPVAPFSAALALVGPLDAGPDGLLL